MPNGTVNMGAEEQQRTHPTKPITAETREKYNHKSLGR